MRSGSFRVPVVVAIQIPLRGYVSLWCDSRRQEFMGANQTHVGARKISEGPNLA